MFLSNLILYAMGIPIQLISVMLSNISQAAMAHQACSGLNGCGNGTSYKYLSVSPDSGDAVLVLNNSQVRQWLRIRCGVWISRLVDWGIVGDCAC